MTEYASDPLDRRAFLAATAVVGTGAVAGCSALEAGDDATTTPVDEGRARELAERFAPTLYFDSAEQWYPTDPRPYESEREGETVVEGFDALDGYTEQFRAAETPPDPTVFHNVVTYDDSPLAVVQYWAYSAFDQFTTNFHWHDWEVLHVFVDTDSDEPALFVASSHSRKVPNNEFLDPERTVPRILQELGSHSSALSVNEERDRFQRLPTGGDIADITNRVVDDVESLASIPVAYGLPRDEGSRLPYVVPELDGAPVYEHDRLPSVEPEDLVPAALTIRSFDALTAPPTDLPERETGLVFEFEGRDDPETDADVAYELRPTTALEHITGFTGPQLSFEFSIPEAVEDAVSGHITTTGEPWTQPRYENPAADISDPNHRRELADRYAAIGDPAPVNAVVTAVSSLVEDGEAPDGEGVTTEDSAVESVALLESEPSAVPTFQGVAVAQGVDSGQHRLTVNGAGVEPHSESITVEDEGVTAAGVDGEIPLVAREDATKVTVDPTESEADVTDFALEDDFGGRLYDAPVEGPEAVYVHRGGAYTGEVRDSDDELGAVRVNPTDEDRIAIERPTTGKESLASFLATITEETRAEIEGLDLDGRANAVQGLVRALEATGSAAQRAAQRAADGDREGADRRLVAVQSGFEQVADNLERAADGLPDPIERAVDRRLSQARKRVDQALDAEKL
ncbi:hypothetical protein GOC74_07490 [Halomicrobium mukohataei]|uniref:Uncharacterized protein n=1 Tax=Halomicrobium mukohataei TaxID=57705 RepID=A0A847TUS0_9EURY|nr:hypothetical protein [Halomicrobium mukohataei]